METRGLGQMTVMGDYSAANFLGWSSSKSIDWLNEVPAFLTKYMDVFLLLQQVPKQMVYVFQTSNVTANTIAVFVQVIETNEDYHSHLFECDTIRTHTKSQPSNATRNSRIVH